MDNSGNILWQKCIGGTGFDEAYAIENTYDGGYIIAGGSYSNDGNVTANHSNQEDYWIVKLDNLGNILWQKALGGTGNDLSACVKLTPDGGYVVSGHSASIDGDVTGNHGGYDYWIVKLDGTGGIQWQKSLGGSNDETIYYNLNSIEPTNDGGYILSGPSNSNDGDVSGNHGGQDYWIVKLLPDIKISPVRPSPICNGTTVTFTAATSYSNCVSPPVFQWKKNGSDVGTNSPVYVDNSLKNADLIYCFLTVDAVNDTSNVIKITVNPKPNIGNDTTVSICAGTTENLNTVYNTTGYASAIWNTPTPSSAGAGTYTLIENSAAGCADTAVVTITEKPKAYATIDTAICFGQTYKGYRSNTTFLDTLQNGAANGCDSILTIHLTVYPEALTTIDTAICYGHTYLGFSNTGTDSLVLQGKAANGCDSVLIIHLTVYPQNQTTIDTTICYPASLQGHATTGRYTQTLKNIHNCDSLVTINLTVLQPPNPSLGADTAICTGQSITLNPGNFTSYLWQDGSIQSTYTVTSAGTYWVNVTNACGFGTDTINVNANTCDVYIPSAFTPNKDGKNDVFKAFNGEGLNSFLLLIYNRWGQKVFETNNPSQSWDGNFNGQPQAIGVYVWYC